MEDWYIENNIAELKEEDHKRQKHIELVNRAEKLIKKAFGEYSCSNSEIKEYKNDYIIVYEDGYPMASQYIRIAIKDIWKADYLKEPITTGLLREIYNNHSCRFLY